MTFLPTHRQGTADPTPPSLNIFPLVRQCSIEWHDPFELYAAVTNYAPHSFFLEHDWSYQGVSRRYSYLGSEPYRVVRGKGHSAQSYVAGKWEEHEGEPFELLKRIFTEPTVSVASSFLPFSGGAIGCLSYDVARTFESFPDHTVDDLQFPDLYFFFVETFVVVDHHDDTVWLVYSPSPERVAGENWEQLAREGDARLSDLEITLRSMNHRVTEITPGQFSLDIHQGQVASEYQRRVKECQEFIAAGDIYQANVSQRFQIEGMHRNFPLPAQAGAVLYHQLRRVNPSPHSAFLVLESDVIVCNSPERLVRLEGGYADMRPIAGTRPRGEGRAQDRRLAEELLSSSKERAEHLMLVDLARNDLGRVCQYGSIRVDEFMTVERYSHVMHLVSHVLGQLRHDRNAFDVIRAVFPGGTITGVPKVHCMELIEQLEPVRRGLYTGSIGFIGWNGNLDLNIVIRTLLLTKEHGYLQVGAGIVADSDPAREYEETLHKAQAFFQVLQHVPN